MWFVNDASLQGQFADRAGFRDILRELVVMRGRLAGFRDNLRVSNMLPQAPIDGVATLREVVGTDADRDLKSAVMNWLDRNGPFVEDDITYEEDDYFEYEGLAVTNSGLGEAARRTKAGRACTTFSFEGGDIDFAVDPLVTDHGLEEDRLGWYPVANRWDMAALEAEILASQPTPTTWRELVDTARIRFPHLDIADLHEDRALARQPFAASVAKSALTLLEHLERYAADRQPDGSVGPVGREVIEHLFSGDNAKFSDESASKMAEYRDKLMFKTPDGRDICAPWHAKISHRYFRMHFEWPLRAGTDRIAIVYLGPKITVD